MLLGFLRHNARKHTHTHTHTHTQAALSAAQSQLAALQREAEARSAEQQRVRQREEQLAEQLASLEREQADVRRRCGMGCWLLAARILVPPP